MDVPAQHASDATLHALAAHFAGMPPVAAMQPRVLGWRDGVLTLGAPLPINVNDKGNAFGGSLCSLMTIAGWGLGFLRLAEAGLDADIYVADSRIRYLKPVYEDLLVEARLETAGEEGAEARDLPGSLRAHGRVGYRVNARTVLADGASAAVLGARYVAIAR
ncbi:YiiD C-terminal domain-containing protein [Thermomonas brevis]